MQGNQPGKCLCTDSRLIAAVAGARSWRGVMRELGLRENAPRSIQLIRERARQLGLDVSHFTGQRRWSDAGLEGALSRAQSWAELLSELGLSSRSPSARQRVKAHAALLCLDTSRLEPPAALLADLPRLEAHTARIREAGTAIAAAWFLLRGCSASLPVEPAVYDLLVTMPDRINRVQVKTTTFHGKDGWVVQVGRRPYSAGNQARLIPYDPDEVDYFFVLDGDLNIYLIPACVIAGRVAIVLRRYVRYITGSAAGLLAATPASRVQAAPTPGSRSGWQFSSVACIMQA